VTVTVVVVSYNVAPLLIRCVRSAEAALSEVGGGEIIVVDNASGDESVELLNRAASTVELMVNTENVGFGAACNQGLARAKAERVLFLNPDAELGAGALAAMVTRLESQPAIGLVGPRVRYPDGRPQPTRRRFPTPAALFLEATPLEWRGPRWAALARFYRDDAPEISSPEDWLSGACLLGRVAALRGVGGFDSDFFMYFEEVDLARRLAAHGWETWYEPAAQLTHGHGKSADQDVAARDRMYYGSKYRYAARYFGRTNARLLRLSGAALLAVELALQRRRGNRAGVERYQALVRWHLSGES